MDKVKLLRWPRLLFGFAVLLLIGIIYAWSILKYPFEAMWDSGALGFNYTLTVIFFFVGIFISGIISKRLSPKARLIIGAVLLFFGFFTSSLIIRGVISNIAILYLSYGISCGMGIGIVYNTVVSSINAWYPDKVGFSSGFMMGGFGLGAMILGRFISMMGTSYAIGWESTYIILAIVLLVVVFVSAFIIKPPSASVQLPQERKNDKSLSTAEAMDISGWQLLKRPTLIKIVIIGFTLSALGSSAVGFAKGIALDVGASAGFAVTVVGLASIGNGLIRPAVGWLYDNIGLRKTQYIVSATVVLAPFTMIFALLTNSLPIGVISLCLFGMSLGMSPITSGVFVSKFYGAKNFSLNFGIVTLMCIPAPFAATLIGVLKDLTGEFILSFVILAFIGVIGAIVNLTIRKP